MVQKSRGRETYTPRTTEGTVHIPVMTSRVYESMSDSSVTGSARTEVDPVDKFLSKPTTRANFHQALREATKSVGDVGLSDFEVNRTRETWTSLDGFITYPWDPSHRGFTGFVLATPGPDSFPTLPRIEPLSKAANVSAGQSLYLRSLPNRDQADLGTVLGEIVTNPVRAAAVPGRALLQAARRQGRFVSRDLSVQAKRRRGHIAGMPLDEARAAADDYLAYIFGARPTVQSLDKLAESITASRRLAEVVSRQGWKRIRRRRNLPRKTQSAQGFKSEQFSSAAGNNQYWLSGSRIGYAETTQDVWFSGSFRMSTTDTDHWLGQCDNLFKTLDRITGLGLDLKVAWDLIPFSFMADWFANTGDFLENRTIIADYNIACEYGYVMCHTRYQQTLIASGVMVPMGYSSPGSIGALSYTKLVESKLRSRSTAVGFEASYEGLNDYQWGAITALGLSSLPGLKPTTRS